MGLMRQARQLMLTTLLLGQQTTLSTCPEEQGEPRFGMVTSW